MQPMIIDFKKAEGCQRCAGSGTIFHQGMAPRALCPQCQEKPMPKVTKAYIFDNGMLMVFDERGQQMPEYQGPVSEVLEKLKKDAPDVRISRGALGGR